MNTHSDVYIPVVWSYTLQGLTPAKFVKTVNRILRGELTILGYRDLPPDREPTIPTSDPTRVHQVRNAPLRRVLNYTVTKETTETYRRFRLTRPSRRSKKKRK